MKKILVIGLLCLGLFVVSAAGLSVVSLDGSLGEYNLVYSSSDPIEVGAFQVLLQCDSDISIIDVMGVSPFEVFNGNVDEYGFVTIAGFTTVLSDKKQNTAFAKIVTAGSGSIYVVGAELEDFCRQKITLENPSVFSDVTQTSMPTPTVVSTSPTQVVTQPTTVPTSEQTQNVGPSQTSTSVPTGQVPLSNNPTPSSTQSPFKLFPIMIGLTAVIFILRRTND